MVQLYLTGAVICAVLLLALAIFILLKNYNPLTAKFASAFFLFGIVALVFIYFGVYRNLPEIEAEERIENGIAKLQTLRLSEQQKKEKVKHEIEEIYTRNEKLLEEFNTLKEKDPTLSYARALTDDQINSLLVFLQHNYASIQELNDLTKQIEARSKQIELDIIQSQAKLVAWESSGGMNGDIDSYMLEEQIYSRIARYKKKIHTSQKAERQLKPLREIWNALLKYNVEKSTM